ncbi:uncharacterized protein PG986_003623 [Apiospora aurea]|uniref:Uncharacterized protein n=1 Tax=Apiospora aurea TaxID=335848 RepID=A0ABR1QS72_9PEZI
MYLSRFAFIAALAMLTGTGLACQCFTDGKPDDARTKTCCREQDGTFIKPGQCQVSSISEHLKEFRACCGGHSDCDFPSEE